MTETPPSTESSGLVSRLRERVRSVSPFSLMILGFLGFVGTAVERLEVLELFYLFWLFAFWPFLGGLVGAIKRSLGYEEETAEPRDWLVMDTGWRAQFAFLLGIPLSILNPLMARQDLMQLLGSLVALVRHRGSLPDPTTFEQAVDYRVPVDGTWTVVNGSPIKEYSHSWFPATQRYAYDFVVTDEAGRTRPEGTDTSVENYYCYDRPVVAPADGTVVAVGDGDPELGRGGGLSHPFKRTITGNAVVIRHATDEYSCLVHLVPGSVAVEPGERVERGQQVGRCGHSGNSSEPHLHFQLQDHPTFELAAGLPVRFEAVAVDSPGIDVAETTEWEVPEETDRGRYVHVGQRVTHDPDADSRRDGTAPDVASRPGGSDATAPKTAPNLARVSALGALGNGLAVGGILTVLAGFVVSSPTTVAPCLAVATGLGLLSQVRRRLRSGDSVRPGTLAPTVGVGLVAVSLTVSTTGGFPSAFGPLLVGSGAFLVGFVLYAAVWEYGRHRLDSDGATAVPV